MSWVKIGATVLLFLVVGSWGWSNGNQRDLAREALEREKTERLSAELQARNVAVLFGNYSAGLESRNDELQGLLDDADARLLAVSEVGVTASDTVLIPVVVDFDSVTSSFSQSPLSGRIAYYPERLMFRLEWDFYDRLRLEHSITSDNRLLVWAESASGNPRVRYTMDTFVYNLPAAYEQRQPPSRLRWLLSGVAVGVVGWELIR